MLRARARRRGRSPQTGRHGERVSVPGPAGRGRSRRRRVCPPARRREIRGESFRWENLLKEYFLAHASRSRSSPRFRQVCDRPFSRDKMPRPAVGHKSSSRDDDGATPTRVRARAAAHPGARLRSRGRGRCNAPRAPPAPAAAPDEEDRARAGRGTDTGIPRRSPRRRGRAPRRAGREGSRAAVIRDVDPRGRAGGG